MSKALELHKKLKSKINTLSNVKKITPKNLSLLYTPGVAEVCQEIIKDKQNLYHYTQKANTVAVISNGTAVLGLGDIGADASLPVMEGKCLLINKMANINAFPICIEEKNPEKFIEIVSKIATSFSAINLEDIKAPECVYIEKQLQKKLSIPVFHDDQHGTCIVILAALINAFKLVKKTNLAKILINGNGAAGYNTFVLLRHFGFKNIIVLNKYGVIRPNSETNNELDEEVAKKSINSTIKGNTLKEAIVNCDVFIGLSAANVLTAQMVNTMNHHPIVFALANPDPEISYEEYKKSNGYIFASGRSDYKNQINNLLVFPAIMKLFVFRKAIKITLDDKVKLAKIIANLIPDSKLNRENIIANALKKKLTDHIFNNF